MRLEEFGKTTTLNNQKSEIENARDLAFQQKKMADLEDQVDILMQSKY